MKHVLRALSFYDEYSEFVTVCFLIGKVNVEKSYAFAEFLTAEDATAGLAFDGITLHGTILKIRRPRDYIPPPVRLLVCLNLLLSMNVV
jgi:hypothetical protein